MDFKLVLLPRADAGAGGGRNRPGYLTPEEESWGRDVPTPNLARS